MWYQRSKQKWLADGDRNTKFYHTNAIQRRRRKIIKSIKNDQDEWVEDTNVTKNMFNAFFHKLYTADTSIEKWIQTRYTYPPLEDGIMKKLSMELHDDEVKHDIQDMAPWKSPGPDGYSAGFYQKT